MYYRLIIIFFPLSFYHLLAAIAPILTSEELCKHAIKQRKAKRDISIVFDHYLSDLTLSDTKPSLENFSCFITDTEIKELEIPWLLDTLDYTQTAFGRQWLQKAISLITADISTIQERQSIEKLLYENSDLLVKAQSILYTIGQLQEPFLSYFDSSDQLNLVAQSLYFDGSSVDWISKSAAKIIKKGNNYTATLKIGFIASLIKRCDSLFISLCKQSMADELIKIAFGMSANLQLDSFLLENIVNSFRAHIPWFKIFNPQTYDGNHGMYSSIMQEGTFADKLGAYVCGSKATDTFIGFKYLPINWRWRLRKQSDFTNWSAVPWYSKAIATVTLLAWTLYKDYRTIEDGKESVKKIKLLFKVMNTLRIRLVKVAQMVGYIRQLSTEINRYPELKDSDFAQELLTINAIANSEKFKELSLLLAKIAAYKSTGNIYDYGVILKAHALLHEIKNEFIPVFQAIGQLDVYCSLATVLKQHHAGKAQFSFVEFIDKQEPYVQLQDCWVPLINSSRVVTNDIYLGVHNWGNKIIITGPNGGGKSTYLKALGQSLYLAHTFGIVPASTGKMTLYTGLRTCFHPRESLSEDMSQFMVEKQCMDTLTWYVQNRTSEQKVMLLIDEPYRGTVDAESAERIYKFGQIVSPIPHASVVVATHVYKPITLAQQTHGIFTNCQVIIDQVADMQFNRTFKVAPGIASWWFNDAQKRANFVDWLAVQ